MGADPCSQHLFYAHYSRSPDVCQGGGFFCPAQKVRREKEKWSDDGSEKTDLFLLLYTRPQKTLSKWTGF